MHLKIVKASTIPAGKPVIYLVGEGRSLDRLKLEKAEKAYVKQRLSAECNVIELNSFTSFRLLAAWKSKNGNISLTETLRRAGNKMYKKIAEHRLEEVYIDATGVTKDLLLAFLEGLVLSSYRFIKYITEKKRKSYLLRTVGVCSPVLSASDLLQLVAVLDAVFRCRDLVNEPVSFLNAAHLSEAFIRMGKEAGFSVEVFNKKKIESLRMGGLLAVNKGSVDPPTFTVMEYMPARARNKKPYVLVGKGIMYDTGGLSLKPTKESMDSMKSDMAGGAVVASLLYALALNRVPVHVIGLVPATDNRPSGNAYAPGDVITMHSGLTVEVLNSDAEGRMILADALSYAKRYSPSLVIDLATLTGAASMAIGFFGMVGMGNAPEPLFRKLQASGNKVNERIVEFPFWDEYKDQLQSDIADLKNIGWREAGAITAGKFLEYFTDYPFIHLDIAGCSFVEKEVSYLGKGATGVGVRLLYHFFKNLS